MIVVVVAVVVAAVAAAVVVVVVITRTNDCMKIPKNTVIAVIRDAVVDLWCFNVVWLFGEGSALPIAFSLSKTYSTVATKMIT
eukprot:2910330-Amphidinium_carterae.1